MNSTKKPFGASGVIKPGNRQAGSASQFKPVVAQFKTAVRQPPVAPPVYRPQPVPRVLQTKKAIPEPARSGAQAEVRRPVAPPAYRPLAVPKVLQAKTDHRAGSMHVKPEFKPLLPGRAGVVQRAAARPKRAAAKRKPDDAKEMRDFVKVAGKKNKWGVMALAGKGQGKCGATIYFKDDEDEISYYEGSYSDVSGFHAEMAALNDFLGEGNEISDITRIEITSPPCKVCNAILNALGVPHLVLVPEGKEDGTGHKSAFKVPDSVLDAVCTKRGITKASLVAYLDAL